MLKKDYIEKAYKFRDHFGLSEKDIDTLLKPSNLKYSTLESGKKTLTLELAEAYPKIVYGIDYCVFKKSETCFPKSEDLPHNTQVILGNKLKIEKRIGLKNTKNTASYIIFLLKDFKVGQKITNSKIISSLPPPMNLEKSIHWSKGILKGLVKNINESNIFLDKNGKEKKEATYQIIKAVDQKRLNKAIENIDKSWLEEFWKEQTRN